MSEEEREEVQESSQPSGERSPISDAQAPAQADKTPVDADLEAFDAALSQTPGDSVDDTQTEASPPEARDKRGSRGKREKKTDTAAPEPKKYRYGDQEFTREQLTDEVLDKLVTTASQTPAQTRAVQERDQKIRELQEQIEKATAQQQPAQPEAASAKQQEQAEPPFDALCEFLLPHAAKIANGGKLTGNQTVDRDLAAIAKEMPGAVAYIAAREIAVNRELAQLRQKLEAFDTVRSELEAGMTEAHTVVERQKAVEHMSNLMNEVATSGMDNAASIENPELRQKFIEWVGDEKNNPAYYYLPVSAYNKQVMYGAWLQFLLQNFPEQVQRKDVGQPLPRKAPAMEPTSRVGGQSRKQMSDLDMLDAALNG